MRFLCEVHISYKLSHYLSNKGFHTEHINQILNKWHTADSAIAAYANQNDFILITKDSDFRDSYLLKKSPKKVIKISLGNISNSNLIIQFEKYFQLIEKEFRSEYCFLEMSAEEVFILK